MISEGLVFCFGCTCLRKGVPERDTSLPSDTSLRLGKGVPERGVDLTVFFYNQVS